MMAFSSTNRYNSLPFILNHYKMTQEIIRAYKYRFYPSKDQTKHLIDTFGCVRFLWNQYVSSFLNHNIMGPTVANASIKQMKVIYPFLSTVSYTSLEQKKRDFEETKKQYFNKNRKKKLGSMKFKKKGCCKDSFRLSTTGCRLSKDNEIFIAQLGKLNAVIDRPAKGKLKSMTISRNSANQYFVSVLILDNVELKQNTGKSIGIDLGFIDLFVLSNGIKFKNPRWFRESQTKLASQQKHLSRKQKGSNRYLKQKLKVARCHLKTKNQRNWYHHVISSYLVENYDVICMEDLNVDGMKRLFGKSASDASLSTLVSFIKYKCLWYGKTFHQVSRWFPSSKTCSCCGHKMQKYEMTLDVREWTCPICFSEHDRDLNAAINILNEGIKDLYSFTSAELVDYKRGEDVSPNASVEHLAASLKRLFSDEFVEILEVA